VQGLKEAKRPILRLYYQLDWARGVIYRLLFGNGLVANKKDSSYVLRVLWSFVCGYTLMDSLIYDFQTPECVRRIIRKARRIVEL